MQRGLWLAIVASVLFNCKPIVREETSEEQYADRLARMFARLVQRGDMKNARNIFTAKFYRYHSAEDAHRLVRYLANTGVNTHVPSFFSSWVQESTRIANTTILEISKSKSAVEVVELLKDLDTQLVKVRIDFIKQREAISAVTEVDGMYKLTKVIDDLEAARQTQLGTYLDFDMWAKDFQRKLDKAFYRNTEAGNDVNFVSDEGVKQAWQALRKKFAPLPKPLLESLMPQ